MFDAILESLASNDRYVSTSKPEDRHLTITLALSLLRSNSRSNVPSCSHAVSLGKEFVRHASWLYAYYMPCLCHAISRRHKPSFLCYLSPQHDDERSKWRNLIDLLYTIDLIVVLSVPCAGAWVICGVMPSVVALIVAGAFLLCCLSTYGWTIRHEEKPFVLLRAFRRFRKSTVLLVVGFMAGLFFFAMSALLVQSINHIFRLTSYISRLTVTHLSWKVTYSRTMVFKSDRFHYPVQSGN